MKQVEKSDRKRSPSPRFSKRSPSPNVDPHADADMNRVKKQVAKVLKARLYLLEQPGPNSFHIGGDSPDHKYKVIIGPQTCTCGKDQFCVHVLFVMLRVFQIKETDPLLWSRELKNYEVETLFTKYRQRIAALSTKKIQASIFKSKTTQSTVLPSPLVVAGNSSHPFSSIKEEEEVCPICLSDLVEGESMTLCKDGCQNRLHHHCMAVWAEECKRRKEKLNCPLCRTVWKSRRSTSPEKLGQSINSHESHLASVDAPGLPCNEVVPEEYKNLTKSWIEIFGFDAVACLFSRDWKHRESGLRYISRKAVKTLTERRSTTSYVENKHETIQAFTAVLEYVLADPVYNVFIGALRAFRAIISAVQNRTPNEINLFNQAIKPVIEKIILKCADANRRVVIIAIKVLIEFVQGELYALSNGSENFMNLIFTCYKINNEELSNWQWWLGRLAFMRRLLDEHGHLVLRCEDDLLNLALPVSPRIDMDLNQFLSSLEENIHTRSTFDDVAIQRLHDIVIFSTSAILSTHKKVHLNALSLLVKCIAISSHDSVAFQRIKKTINDLNHSIKSKLHRHLSSEAQREQHDILNILDDYEDHPDQRGTFDVTLNEDEEKELAEAGASAALTPPASPKNVQKPHVSPPSSAYDPGLKCVRQVEDDEAVALAVALEKSMQRPENVIPEQLIPTDDITLVYIQPVDGRDSETCSPKNVYLENIHWKKGGLLGTGAFSTCYEAMDFKSGRLMAVKQISFCRNCEEEQNKVHEVVLEEIALLTKLKHPNIVSCIGATQHEGHYNLFMELMPGGSISRLLLRFGPFRESVILSYTRQILQALAYLHQHHTLHRDLKGANILVDSTGQIVKLSDFGTAARLLSKCTGTKEFSGQLLGTIPFMAPEVLRGAHYGRKCDIWSLGCCVIEMATSQHPWGTEHSDNHLALMFKIASANCSPSIPQSLGPGLRDLVLRCLEIKESDRPTSHELLQHAIFRI
ncbi:mitogen-activated protein kinase kinase kinase 1 isoform X2 [Hydra vulgaris]|uniref:mitogen-activated protein kinase kinase kinase 1 isoform X2 n=1 Tax=Hydra vulgaris TaxID=6087 RepID=UPI0032EA61DD